MPELDARDHAKEPLEAAVEAWWLAVLAGERKRPHPRHPRINVDIQDQRLSVAGAVASEAELREVEQEARQYCGHVVKDIDFDQVSIAPESDEVVGLLRQVVFAMFESREQAQLAAELLEDREPSAAPKMSIVDTADRIQDSAVPSAYEADLKQRLQAGRVALVIEVDETDVFRMREQLARDTRSLETVVAPPKVRDGDAPRHLPVSESSHRSR